MLQLCVVGRLDILLFHNLLYNSGLSELVCQVCACILLLLICIYFMNTTLLSQYSSLACMYFIMFLSYHMGVCIYTTYMYIYNFAFYASAFNQYLNFDM
jgi:hypothetical protein